MTTSHFGHRLRDLRIDRGFTSQAQFAEYCGIAPKTVCRHEQSARPPRAIDRTLQAYMRVLRVDEMYLMHGLGDPPKIFRAVGKKIPPNVERYLSEMRKGDPIHEAIKTGLLAFDWVGAGKPNPTEWEVKSLALVLEGWAQK